MESLLRTVGIRGNIPTLNPVSPHPAQNPVKAMGKPEKQHPEVNEAWWWAITLNFPKVTPADIKRG